MIEVFRTNVTYSLQAMFIRERIMQFFPEYKVNFDLGDCDRVLRIEAADTVDVAEVIRIVSSIGFDACILADEVPWDTMPLPERVLKSSEEILN